MRGLVQAGSTFETCPSKLNSIEDECLKGRVDPTDRRVFKRFQMHLQ